MIWVAAGGIVFVTAAILAGLMLAARAEEPNPLAGCDPPENKQIMDLVRLLRRAGHHPRARETGRHRRTAA